VVSRRYARPGLGAALLTGPRRHRKKEYRAELMRIDVRTTNEALHAYYERQHFVRCSNPRGLGDYPSQALIERSVHMRSSRFFSFSITEDGRAAKDSPF
jgi:hypothetical protein